MPVSPELQAIALGKVLVAVILGGIIGWEREKAHKVAGLRTHMFISGSAAIFVLLSIEFTEFFQNTMPADSFRADPVRVIHAIIVGVSFIGAGMIIQNEKRDRVVNLTTAASVMFTAATGIAVALGAYIFAVGVAVMALVINHSLKSIEHKLPSTDSDLTKPNGE
ncbi:MAG: putative Mg2+ transporter-C (MgtC) family protein [Candidatus Sumerlaeota bacterium]|nr:putative Mg2+ transporter-C (MgtC) family protein [Candidatus Sumerlaeota bacterium]